METRFHQPVLAIEETDTAGRCSDTDICDPDPRPGTAVTLTAVWTDGTVAGPVELARGLRYDIENYRKAGHDLLVEVHRIRSEATGEETGYTGERELLDFMRFMHDKLGSDEVQKYADQRHTVIASRRQRFRERSGDRPFEAAPASVAPELP